MTWTSNIIGDLLRSVNRLNDELSDRCKFEQSLIEAIQQKDSRINELEAQISTLNSRIIEVQLRFDKLNKEAEKYTSFVHEHLLKRGEEIVFDVEKEEYYIHKDTE